jgi:uncharacterized membrane protein YbhN (UPF0104 family)
MISCDTLGWRFAFRRDRVPLGVLFRARLAGEAVNMTTPTASLGGEPVKTWLIRGHVPLAESLPSVIIAKTTITIGQALFLLVGVLVAWQTLPDTSGVLRGMPWLLALECLAIGGFVATQCLGGVGGAGRLLHRLGVLGGDQGRAALGRIDREFAEFYRREPRRFTYSVLWHFGGWAVGALEAYLILWALDRPVSLGTAVVVEAFDAGVAFAAFMIPARLGAQEAGDIAIFTALGLGAPIGLAFTVVRRLRQVVWAALGYLALASLQRAPAHSRSVPATPQAEV